MWSKELNEKLLQLAESKLAIYNAFISEMEQTPQDERYLVQHTQPLGSRPIRVLTTGQHGVHSIDPPRPPDLEQQKYEEAVTREQATWLKLSTNAKQPAFSTCPVLLTVFWRPPLLARQRRVPCYANSAT
jgi:hypothetical protein